MIATGCHKMSSNDHLHVEVEMLKVREHSELLFAQYLAKCLESKNLIYSMKRTRMKKRLITRHRNTIVLMMLAEYRKATLQAIHTDAGNKAVNSQERNIMLDDHPPPIKTQNGHNQE